MLSFSKTFLVDLKISTELLEFLHLFDFVYFVLQIFCGKFLEHFSYSSSLLILIPFDCLHSSWCSLSWKFSVIGLNSGLKFSGKLLNLYLGLFLCQVQILEKDGACLFFSAGFCIFQ